MCNRIRYGETNNDRDEANSKETARFDDPQGVGSVGNHIREHSTDSYEGEPPGKRPSPRVPVEAFGALIEFPEKIQRKKGLQEIVWVILTVFRAEAACK